MVDLLRSYLHVQPHRVRPRGVMGALAWLGVCVGTGNATGPRGCGSSVCTSVAIGLSPPSLLKASVELRFPRYISAQLVFPDNAEFDRSPRDQRSSPTHPPLRLANTPTVTIESGPSAVNGVNRVSAYSPRTTDQVRLSEPLSTDGPTRPEYRIRTRETPRHQESRVSNATPMSVTA